ncbi:MAG: hypothetical protein HOE19_02190 [Candidatus Komeilibacteria bacterium]|jgi:hypothetical protein|nr:hypothetical protein [Candidatus Komeilibacteria bacterium]MBT4447198.1 hypothetical protein [Candidatus Komeilibacteria bacterium]
MIINNLELFFDRQEGNNLFFKTQTGQELVIDEGLLVDFSDRDKKVYLNLDSQQTSNQPQDVLNEILKINNE